MARLHCRWPQPKPDVKRCVKCEKAKPYTREHWGPSRRSASGLADGWCRRCVAARSKGVAKDNRINALIHYGEGTPICACCGDNRFEFLTLDHIHGGGNEHRLQVTGSKKGSIYSWLKKNNYPPGFQVLCYNCNMGRAAHGGECPYATSHPYRQNATRRRSA
jgi:hypothetical protein